MQHVWTLTVLDIPALPRRNQSPAAETTVNNTDHARDNNSNHKINRCLVIAENSQPAPPQISSMYATNEKSDL
jgi:hypothetical protein